MNIEMSINGGEFKYISKQFDLMHVFYFCLINQLQILDSSERENVLNLDLL